jgi:hypothetical protein
MVAESDLGLSDACISDNCGQRFPGNGQNCEQIQRVQRLRQKATSYSYKRRSRFKRRSQASRHLDHATAIIVRSELEAMLIDSGNKSRFRTASYIDRLCWLGMAGLQLMCSDVDFSYFTLNHREGEDVRDTLKTIQRSIRRHNQQHQFSYVGVSMAEPHAHSHFIFYGVIKGTLEFTTVEKYCVNRGMKRSGQIKAPWHKNYVGAVNYLRENCLEGRPTLRFSRDIGERAHRMVRNISEFGPIQQIRSHNESDVPAKDFPVMSLSCSTLISQSERWFQEDVPELISAVRKLQLKGVSKLEAVQRVLEAWRVCRCSPQLTSSCG